MEEKENDRLQILEFRDVDGNPCFVNFKTFNSFEMWENFFKPEDSKYSYLQGSAVLRTSGPVQFGTVFTFNIHKEDVASVIEQIKKFSQYE